MILLIDDNDNERAMIRKMLESGGHDVREATGGDEGVAQFAALSPALVLCDLMMPLKDGFATIADIQARNAAAKIIAMSGVWYGPADHGQMARSLGLRAVIEKPFGLTQLLDLVKRTLAPPTQAKPGKKAGARPRKKAKAAARRSAKKTRTKAKAGKKTRRAKRKS